MVAPSFSEHYAFRVENPDDLSPEKKQDATEIAPCLVLPCFILSTDIFQ